MEYVCLNPECDKFEVREYLSSESFVIRGDRLVGKNAACPSCGKERQEINSNKDIPIGEKNIGMNFFPGMNKDRRREELKKRSHAHFNKEIKERKEGMLNQAMTEMRGLHKK